MEVKSPSRAGFEQAVQESWRRNLERPARRDVLQPHAPHSQQG